MKSIATLLARQGGLGGFMLLKIITTRDDGCFVRIEEAPFGMLKVTLLSSFDVKEVVDQRTIRPNTLLGLLELWESF